ncbi:AarF/ABC1/UbiB kinase family protein [Conexibacter sp. JD483]|uniref:ABC1 kinase family protein n=1 Tax=unclassified Conexibacter TaxID=2627773 RepID=UPI002725E539|nr:MULTISPECIES: AarF/ABC1/UbiB kinase family protein [unclassified Conexibacter]MDO8186077.1 AarF/ABC1/UbiB kinase family protein [Conexibacter sp. CPCC 205706]MDO8199567.1 AarF/ABC1/UbiB kinase family protein [Conexibacter sp. CPCC 205762]MDR9372423.1 AarF/ABC1/UbiB kinase family protein [Conexibacter sp. JD483]
MSAERDDDEPAAGRLPTGRLARTARVGGLVAGQGARWAGMRAANRVRSPERAEAAEQERTAALVDQLVTQLGQMRGAAMKVGQLISLADFDGLPEEQQEELQRRLAALRDDVPPVPFPKLEALLRKQLGGPLSQTFSAFDERAFAAASIGQVHRATTRDGDEVVVKVQYPGVAEAVETDLRNASLLLPLVRRLAPGIDAKALMTELRERIGEELDYELEAQSQRRVERLLRGHPFARVPRVRTDLSTQRVLISEYVEGERFEAVRRLDEAARDRYGEIVFRFFFGLTYRDRIALGDPHPGNYLLCADGRVCFLDFGLLRDVPPARVTGEAALAAAVRDRDPDALTQALVTAGYLPPARAAAVDPEWAMGALALATRWYARPGYRRFSPGDARPPREREGGRSKQERSEDRAQANLFTLPPEALLIRRMHGIVAVVLGQLRAGADWGAIAAEYLHGAAPSTPLGEAEAAFVATRGRG